VKGTNMTIVIQESFVVKPEKQAEFNKLMHRMLKYMKDNPKQFKELKWTKTFTQMFGGTYGTHITLMEFNNLTDMEKLDKRTMKDQTLIKLNNEMMPLIEPTTYKSNVWTTLE
jgi:aldehyde:ferredoxin oxidoreductase